MAPSSRRRPRTNRSGAAGLIRVSTPLAALLMTMTVSPAASAAETSATPAAVGQSSGTVTLDMGETPGYSLEILAPAGTQIGRPTTAYECRASDTAQVMQSDDFAPGMRCTIPSGSSSRFGVYTYPVRVDTDVVPGTTLSALTYELVNRNGTIIDSGAVDVPIAPLTAPPITSPEHGAVLSENRPTITGTADNLAGTALSVSVRDDDGEAIGTAQVVDGEWEVTVDQPLPAGTHTLTASTELNGATSPLSELSLVIDGPASSAPAETPPPSIEPAPNSTIGTEDATRALAQTGAGAGVAVAIGAILTVLAGVIALVARRFRRRSA